MCRAEPLDICTQITTEPTTTAGCTRAGRPAYVRTITRGLLDPPAAEALGITTVVTLHKHLRHADRKQTTTQTL